MPTGLEISSRRPPETMSPSAREGRRGREPDVGARRAHAAAEPVVQVARLRDPEHEPQVSPSVAALLRGLRRERLQRAGAPHDEGDLARALDRVADLLRVLDRAAVHAHDDVAGPQARLLRRARVHDLVDLRRDLELRGPGPEEGGQDHDRGEHVGEGPRADHDDASPDVGAPVAVRDRRRLARASSRAGTRRGAPGRSGRSRPRGRPAARRRAASAMRPRRR